MTNNNFDITNEICKLMKYSPRRKSIFDKIKRDLKPHSPVFVYYVCIDTNTSIYFAAVKYRFEQEEYQQSQNFKDVLINACNKKDYTKELSAV